MLVSVPSPACFRTNTSIQAGNLISHLLIDTAWGFFLSFFFFARPVSLASRASRGLEIVHAITYLSGKMGKWLSVVIHQRLWLTHEKKQKKTEKCMIAALSLWELHYNHHINLSKPEASGMVCSIPSHHPLFKLLNSRNTDMWLWWQCMPLRFFWFTCC